MLGLLRSMEPGGEREQRELRRQAAEYYQHHEVPQRLEEALNATYPLRPADLYGHLANYFSKYSKPPVICKLVGKRVLDGVGRPTLEVEVFCTVKNNEKRICSTVIPSHSDIFENASPEAIDADDKERNDSIKTALEWVNESVNEILKDMQPTDQCKIDKLLGEYFTKKVEEEEERKKTEKQEQGTEISMPTCISSPPAAVQAGKKKASKIGMKTSVAEKPIPPMEPVEPPFCGSIAIAGISLAVAKTGATVDHTPLYSHIAWLKHDQDLPKELTVSLPMVTLLSCGKSSPGKVKLMKEVMLIPPAGLTVKQGIERILDIQKEMMWLLEPACKASSPQLADSKKGSARNTGKKAPPPVLKRISHLGCLTTGFDTLEQPLVLVQTACRNIGLELGIDVYLAINCAAHELMDYDCQQWSNICNMLSSKCYLIAEDASKIISKLVIDQNIQVPKCSGLVVKYTNQTTITDLIELTRILDGQRHITILGSPDGESSDDSLVDLAVGLGARFIKLGGLSRGERVTKYNRLLAIEEELAKNGALRMSFFLALFSACNE